VSFPVLRTNAPGLVLRLLSPYGSGVNNGPRYAIEEACKFGMGSKGTSKTKIRKNLRAREIN
jgi:hypothetical protein